MKPIALLPFLLALLPTPAAAATVQSLDFGRFGRVSLYGAARPPEEVVLFVSGDGGWNQGVVSMARHLSDLGALVVGIDIRHYLRSLAAGHEECSYPAGDFELLSKFVQKSLDRPVYLEPILVGYSSGATLVYAALAESPENTFKGALSLGFCTDLPIVRPFCRGSGLVALPGPHGKGYLFEPSANLPAPWIALQGQVDTVCGPAEVDRFGREAHPAEVVALPHVGHGFSVEKNWRPQFEDAYRRLAAASGEGETDDRESGDTAARGGTAPGGDPAPAAGAVETTAPPKPKDLPLVEVPARAGTSDTLAVIVSGDGGWSGLDKSIAAAFAGRGIDTVGLNSLKYFWTARTPDGAAADLHAILAHYLPRWKKERILLIGYSFGAEVLPFLMARLPEELRKRVRLMTLIGPGQTASFAFHVAEWLGRDDPDARPILPEIERLAGSRILCLGGEDEKDSLCRKLKPEQAMSEIIPGGHHFGGDYDALADRILERAGE
jgi:type IV secretory pathway VirJ component